MLTLDTYRLTNIVLPAIVSTAPHFLKVFMMLAELSMSPLSAQHAQPLHRSTPPMAWAVVLAAGDGSRLAMLTQDNAGNQVPKQFCSLTGGHALLHDAVQRAMQVASPERTCVIVAKSHRRHWSRVLSAFDTDNVFVQPQNCGTAVGVLLATLQILKRDPVARIIFVPADHYVHDEIALTKSMRDMTVLLSGNQSEIMLLGIQPEGIDCDLGYIVPGRRLHRGAWAVSCFVEKPDPSHAASLLARGAVWNSFIFSSSAQTIVDLMHRHMPKIVDDMWSLLTSSMQKDALAQALQDLYQNLPTVDFSSRVLQEAHDFLRLVIAPACGWTDLGTPKRVVNLLRGQRNFLPERISLQGAPTGVLNLAVQCERLGVSA